MPIEGSNYYLFKRGIEPAWEDPANSNGGRWSIQLPREKNKMNVDKWWLDTMLTAIGETFETPYIPSSSSSSTSSHPSPQSLTPKYTDEVTGIIVSSRKAFWRISIWTRSSSSTNPETRNRIDNIGRHFKYGVLGVKEPVSFSNLLNNPSLGLLGSNSNTGLNGVGVGVTPIGGIGGGGGGGAGTGGLASDVEFQSHKDSQRKPSSRKELWVI